MPQNTARHRDVRRDNAKTCPDCGGTRRRAWSLGQGHAMIVECNTCAHSGKDEAS